MKKAEVSFSKSEAVITYNPKVTNVSAIIKVVENTPGMMGPETKYGATVHKGN